MADEKKKRWVNLSRLPPERKRKAWAYLQKHQPATAELVASDAVQTAMREFNADVIVEIEMEPSCDK